MLIHKIETGENQIFSQLPHSELKELAPYIELVSLSQSEIVYEMNEKIEYVYFPINALVSLQKFLEDGSTVEIEMVGKEGFLDISVILNNDVTFSQAVVMQAGHAYRISTKALKGFLTRSGGRRQGMLKTLMLEYAQTLLMNVSQISVCNCRHTLEQRLSRWLLLTFARLESTNLSITHETIGYLLGVRRESVTEFVHKFQLSGIIYNRRGHMELKNKALLEDKACKCYHTMQQGLSMCVKSKKAA